MLDSHQVSTFLLVAGLLQEHHLHENGEMWWYCQSSAEMRSDDHPLYQHPLGSQWFKFLILFPGRPGQISLVYSKRETAPALWVQGSVTEGDIFSKARSKTPGIVHSRVLTTIAVIMNC